MIIVLDLRIPNDAAAGEKNEKGSCLTTTNVLVHSLSQHNPFFLSCHHHLSLLWGMAPSSIYDALCTKWVQPFKSPFHLLSSSFFVWCWLLPLLEWCLVFAAKEKLVLNPPDFPLRHTLQLRDLMSSFRDWSWHCLFFCYQGSSQSILIFYGFAAPRRMSDLGTGLCPF